MSIVYKALQQCAKPIVKLDHTSFSMEFFLTTSFIGFEGHFPNKPILPAIVQILMAQLCIAKAMHKEIVLQDVLQAKFSSPIEPECNVTCIINKKQDELWDCSIMVEQLLAAKFRIKGEI